MYLRSLFFDSRLCPDFKRYFIGWQITDVNCSKQKKVHIRRLYLYVVPYYTFKSICVFTVASGNFVGRWKENTSGQRFLYSSHCILPLTGKGPRVGVDDY